jgi:steroid 5-alpha reductase family enzyme
VPQLELSLFALQTLLAAAFVTWGVSLLKRDVSIVDTLWGVMLLLAALIYALGAETLNARALLALALITTWSLRLSLYIAWRQHGQPEDRRYQAIRRRNEPGFAVKSLYLVFGLQALLAWLISAPLLVIMTSEARPTLLDGVGALLIVSGLAIEALADWQLARFKAHAGNAGQVMDHGLWRYSRHPNYFGEFCVWWGVYLMALAAGGWWTLFSPLLMSLLLLRISGVALLERDIGERRPAYAAYRARTNAFLPGRPRN